MAHPRRTIITGLGAALCLALLAGCSVVAPAPFSGSLPAAAKSAPQATAVRPTLGERLGLSAGNMLLWDPTDVRRRKIDAVAASGARWLEFDIDWNSIQQGGPTSYWWDATDRVVIDAKARKLKLLGMLGYSPTWARPASCPPGTDKCLPANAEHFASFAKAAAKRYGATSSIPALRGGIQAWQIWNEPNINAFAKPKIDPGLYTRMLKRSYVEIKKVDPVAIVLAGGTAPAFNDASGENMAPARFLNRIYASGGKGYFDAFAHHPYSFPCNPMIRANWNGFTMTKYLHDAMVIAGDGAKKIWGTEAGAPTGADVGTCSPTGGRSVTEAMQSKFVVDYFKAWYGDYGKFTGPLFWYSIRDNGDDPMYFDDHFGLLRRDFSPKPAYATLQKLAKGY